MVMGSAPERLPTVDRQHMLTSRPFHSAIKPLLVAATLALALTFAVTSGVTAASAAVAQKTFSIHPRVKVAGHAKVGLLLTATTGTWKPGSVSFAYQWKLNTHAVGGATGRTFAVTSADLGKRLTVTVTASKTGYVARITTSKRTKVVVYQTFMTKNGTYRVRSKVAAGTYVALHPKASCYWQRLGASPNVYGSILGQEFLAGQAIATIQPGDVAFKTAGCGPWMKLADIPTKFRTTIPSAGDYLVGKQVAAGSTWTAHSPTAQCNWSLVEGFSGDFSADVPTPGTEHGIGAPGTPVTVTILASGVVGLQVQYCGTWTQESLPG